MKKKRQTNFDIIQLYGENNPAPQVIKVGILPFTLSESGLKMMVMKPLAENEVLGKPQFQIAKGTRRINISGHWCDMRVDDLLYADESFHEPLIETALREGNEEIGLKPENIKTLYDLGGFTFISASKGVKKPMHLFAAKMIDVNDFEAFEATTSETCWFTEAEFSEVGREDHVCIMKEAVSRLKHI